MVCVSLLFVLGSLTGCLVVPTNYYLRGSRRNVEPETTNTMVIGKTTKDTVFLTLGEPDSFSGDEQQLNYAWTKVKAFWFIGGYGSGIGGEIPRTYEIQVKFDPSNYVSGVRLVKEWGSSVTHAAESENTTNKANTPSRAAQPGTRSGEKLQSSPGN